MVVRIHHLEAARRSIVSMAVSNPHCFAHLLFAPPCSL
eukprot:COSAG03_NODE_27453_length_253_cov_0.668831_1_plen_37_part_01